MIIDDVDHRTVISALELAVRAPSVHNNQPWRFVLGPRSVHLYTDLTRWLPATDAATPTGTSPRGSWTSSGHGPPNRAH